MKRSHWFPYVAAGAVMEVIALRGTDHEATLSRFTRWLFRTNRLEGRVAFVIAMGWFVCHILGANDEGNP